jgi:hypothetical protein
MKNDENFDPKPVSGNMGAGKNKPGKEEFKKGVVTTSIIGFIILLVIVIIGFSLYHRDHNLLITQMETQQNSLSGKIASRDSVIGEWISTFDEIEKNIAMIKEKEHVISMNSSNNELSKDKRQQVLDDIQYINTLLEQNKQKIASLTAQLKKSGGTIKALENKISELEAAVKQNEIEISDLKSTLLSKNFEIDQLNSQNSDLKSAIVQKDEKIDKQTYEINKAYYACGTYKELKTKGLLTKKGGFIGLGKTKSLPASFPDTAFVQIDITKTLSIPLNSRKARLISEHPANSYQFIKDKESRIESLSIKDPALFWKVSKYAVVEITK